MTKEKGLETTPLAPWVRDESERNAATDKDLQPTLDWLLHLLDAAPIILCSIGQCFAIAWSDGVDNITQKRDNPTLSKFLRTNLVKCSDLGREAFGEAEDRMSRITLSVQNITESGGVIDKTRVCLKDKHPSIPRLSELLGDLERLANECVQNSEKVSQGIKEWQALVEKMALAYYTTGDKISSKMHKSRGNPKATGASPEQQKLDDAVGGLEAVATNSEVTHKYVSQFLRNCKINLRQLEAGAERLRSFFNRLHTLASTITRGIGSVKPMTLPERLNQEHIDILSNHIKQLDNGYIIAGGASSTFVEALRRYIIPGITKVDSLSKTKTERGDIEEMIKGISQQSREAQKGIHDLVEERRRELKKILFDTDREIAETEVPS